MKPSLIEPKGEADECTMVAGDFITPLSETGRFSRQKIIKGIDELNNAVSQLDINDIYRQEAVGLPGGAVTKNPPAMHEMWV